MAEMLVTWDLESSTLLQAGLQDEELLRSRAGRARQILHGDVNRSVLVIPIPCLGDEPARKRSVLDVPLLPKEQP